MFHSEHLQEKWAPLLNYEGLDPIKDSHRKAVTAVLLENQEKFLREQSAFENGTTMLTETPNMHTNSGASGSPAGFSGAAGAAGPVAGFDPVLISLIRRSMPNLVAYDLAGVQPMNGPTGLIFAMRSRYENRYWSGRHSSTKSIQHSLDKMLVAISPKATMLMVPVVLLLVLLLLHKQGSNPNVLNPIGADEAAQNAQQLQYKVGQGMQTAILRHSEAQPVTLQPDGILNREGHCNR